jgi:CO/xanthine dehydrogenase FAD-binding subunit
VLVFCDYDAVCALPVRTTTLYFQPHTLADAADALAKSGGQLLAGGTDFYPALGDRPVTTSVIDISRVAELHGIRMEAETVVIGGAATWSEIVRHPLPPCFDALKAAAREIGGIQIQNRGTIAGNLCNASPAADSVPPLLTLDAEVELVSSAGTHRLALNDFILGNRKTALRPDEILARVLIPRRTENAHAAFLKLGARKYLVISISMVAAVIQIDPAGCVAEARVAVGSCSAKAQRLPDLERDLQGMRAEAGIGAMVRSEHLRQLSPIDDLRATAEYRRDASLTLVQRALGICCAGVR